MVEAFLHRSLRCPFRSGAGGGDPDLHRQAAGRTVPAGGGRGFGLADRGRRYASPPPKTPQIKMYTFLKPVKSPQGVSLSPLFVNHHALLLLPGWHEGERLRDGERGWFLAECAQPITCQATIERNMQRMDRLQGLETNV